MTYVRCPACGNQRLELHLGRCCVCWWLEREELLELREAAQQLSAHCHAEALREHTRAAVRRVETALYRSRPTRQIKTEDRT